MKYALQVEKKSIAGLLKCNYLVVCALPPVLHWSFYAYILLVFTFKEQVGFGKVQLVTERCGGVLHPCAGFKFNSYLQLEEKIQG